MPEESSEIPQDVSSEITSEVKKELEGSEESWNQKFNNLADKLEAGIQNTRGVFGSTKPEASVPLRTAAMFGENLAIEKYKALLKLAELAAKATGGRQTEEEK